MAECGFPLSINKSDLVHTILGTQSVDVFYVLCFLSERKEFLYLT